MKKLVFFSEESIFSGFIKCGIAEVVDSLAHSLTGQYEISVICKEGNSQQARKATDFIESDGVLQGQFLQVNYYLIQPKFWPEKAYSIIDKIKPDILHNFDNPELISRLSFIPNRAIYTFDDLDFLKGKEEFLEKYNYITTFSRGYSDYILSKNNSMSIFLKNSNFEKVSIGIATDVFDPAKGLLLPYIYNSSNLTGKQDCKRRLSEKLNFSEEECVFLYMGRLVREKGIEEIIKACSFLKQNNIKLIVVGEGEEKYEEAFESLSKNKEVIYIKKHFFPAQILSLLAGADFYLSPSEMESGGLMPMTASQYGAIPIVTQNGGLMDNFDDDNAIIIKDSIIDAFNKALILYNNKKELNKKRSMVMSQDFSWDTRQKDFIRLYESV